MEVPAGGMLYLSMASRGSPSIHAQGLSYFTCYVSLQRTRVAVAHIAGQRSPRVCIRSAIFIVPLTCAMQGVSSYGEEHARIWDLARDAGWVRDYRSGLPCAGEMHVGHERPD